MEQRQAHGGVREPGRVGEPMRLRCLYVEPRLRISSRMTELHTGCDRRGGPCGAERRAESS
jgi:hypothetical protein